MAERIVSQPSLQSSAPIEAPPNDRGHWELLALF